MTVAVTILTYHSIDDSGSIVSVSPAAFRAHMESLASWGWRGVSLATLCDAWEGRAPLPDPAVVLTFDDGYQSVLESAAPVLARLGFQATMFVVAGRIGLDNGWPGQATWVPRLPLCGWDGLRELLAAGFSIGAHGVSHAALPALAPSAAEDELSRSRTILEDGLGVSVGELAYPYGEVSEPVRAAARAHYRAACGVTMGRASAGADRFDLPRIDAYYVRSPRLFRAMPTVWGRIYLGGRGVLRGIRGR